jgi:hypothetical protein
MPIHDWTRVNAGMFHHFHQTWIPDLARVLNSGRLPPDYYALAEQSAGEYVPDVLALQGPAVNEAATEVYAASRNLITVSVAERPPAVRLHATADIDLYARKADTVTVRHSSDDRVVAMIEIVSPGNKSGRHALGKFVTKAVEMLESGVHLLIVDLLPPGTFDPQGIHGAIWEEYTGEPFVAPPGLPLTLAAYIGGGEAPEAYVEPTAVGAALIDMPLFLEPDAYVPTPLEMTYQSAWEAVPAIWRAKLE